MKYLVIDLEMCMVKGNGRRSMQGERQEIIQIGAVMLDEERRMIDEFSSYVKPEYGKIDSFIEGLTGIKQEDVEHAPKLRAVLMAFADWIADREVVVLSWSDTDYQQLRTEMRVKINTRWKQRCASAAFRKWDEPTMVCAMPIIPRGCS